MYKRQARYKVSEELLIRANSLEAEEVEEGDSLVIPVMRLFGFCSAEHLGEPVYPYEYVLRSLTAIAPRWFFLDENGSVHGSPDKKLLALTRMAEIELWPVVNVLRRRFLEDGARTVSYTHLDVYKRQSLDCGGGMLRGKM